jgi:hypothetical protein
MEATSPEKLKNYKKVYNNMNKKIMFVSAFFIDKNIL